MSDDLSNSFYWQDRAWAAESKRDALALQLQAAQDALALVVAENTANVAALAEAERAQMERDCLIACRHCRAGGIPNERYGQTIHDFPGWPVYCNAAPIRAAFAALHPEPAP